MEENSLVLVLQNLIKFHFPPSSILAWAPSLCFLCHPSFCPTSVFALDLPSSFLLFPKTNSCVSSSFPPPQSCAHLPFYNFLCYPINQTPLTEPPLTHLKSQLDCSSHLKQSLPWQTQWSSAITRELQKVFALFIKYGKMQKRFKVPSYIISKNLRNSTLANESFLWCHMYTFSY